MIVEVKLFGIPRVKFTYTGSNCQSYFPALEGNLIVQHYLKNSTITWMYAEVIWTSGIRMGGMQSFRQGGEKIKLLSNHNTDVSRTLLLDGCQGSCEET